MSDANAEEVAALRERAEAAEQNAAYWHRRNMKSGDKITELADRIAALRAVAASAKLGEHVLTLLDSLGGLGYEKHGWIREALSELRSALASCAGGAARSPGASPSSAGPSTGDAGAACPQCGHVRAGTLHMTCVEQAIAAEREACAELLASATSAINAANDERDAAVAALRERASVSPGPAGADKETERERPDVVFVGAGDLRAVPVGVRGENAPLIVQSGSAGETATPGDDGAPSNGDAGAWAPAAYTARLEPVSACSCCDGLSPKSGPRQCGCRRDRYR